MVLPFLIDNFQHAFVPGRYMSDNVLLSHELLDFINKRRRMGPTLASLKLDMSKAYDRVHWDFLLRILRAYGFTDRWLHVVHQCISTVSFKALINGKTSEKFYPRCVIRQGNPLSPFLFLFCMDILSRMLSLQEALGEFHGIKIARRAPTISHLFFADDAMLFFKTSPQAFSSIVNTLSRFCRISGQ